jgi:hypothetical protein
LITCIYSMLLDIPDIPSSLLETVKKHLPITFIIRPHIRDLIQQRIFIFSHEDEKYSVATWHHEQFFETPQGKPFRILSAPILEDTMDLYDDNDLTIDVHAKVMDIFHHGELWIEPLQQTIPASSISLSSYQTCKVQGTIPRINTTNVYDTSQCAHYHVKLHLS